MQKKTNNKWCYVIIAVILLGLLGFVWYKNRNNPAFFHTNLVQLLTLFVAILLSYGATQRRLDKRKEKEQIEKLIDKIQKLVNELQQYSFKTIENSEEIAVSDINKEIRMSSKKINNCIDVVGKLKDELKIGEEYDYIKREFKEYSELYSDNMFDTKKLVSVETELKKYLNNIDSKCDYIIVKLFSNI